MACATLNLNHRSMEHWKPPKMPEIKTKHAVGYVRLSDRGADGTEVSLERQKSEIQKWCDSHGLTLVAVFEDVGQSGKKLTRKGLEAAIGECSLRGALLVAYSVDRIARDIRIMDRLKREGISFRALDFPEVSEYMLDVLMFVGGMYSILISGKMKSYHKNRKEKAAAGEMEPHPTPSNRPPVDVVAANAAKAREARQVNVRTKSGYAWAKIKPLLADGLSYRQIAANLNESGYLTPRQKPWTHVAVGRVVARCQGAA